MRSSESPAAVSWPKRCVIVRPSEMSKHAMTGSVVRRMKRRSEIVLVVGLDGSSTSWDAFVWAAGEASRGQGSLVAVYVTHAVEPFAALGVPYEYAAVEEARREFAGQLKDEAEHRARDLG